MERNNGRDIREGRGRGTAVAKALRWSELGAPAEQ